MAGYPFWRETDTYPPMRNKILGVALVLAGASCYGVLSVFIKTAYTRGYTPSEILISQFSVAIVLLAVIEAIRRRKPVARVEPLTALRLVAGGTAIGLVGIFYYLTIQYSSVSAAIVLLMQSVWIGLAGESLRRRRWPSATQLVPAVLVVAGSLLATNVLGGAVAFTPLGLFYGLVAATCYTGSIWVSDTVGTGVHPLPRSLLMVVGGAAITLPQAVPHLLEKFDPGVLWPWSVLAAVLGTIAPQYLLNRGVPLTGIALATILTSVELPVSVIMAQLVLGEAFSGLQWVGVAVILFAIALANARPAPRMAVIA